MKKLTLTIFILSLFLIFNSNSQSNNDAIRYLKEGNKIIFIRHALAPGRGDPPGFKIDDCKTQRNLDQIGINQSKKIGKIFRENKIKIDQCYRVNSVDAKIQQDMHLKILMNFQL